MNKDLTLQEVKDMKRAMEDATCSLVQAFEGTTGTLVTTVRLRRNDVFNGESALRAIEMLVEL